MDLLSSSSCLVSASAARRRRGDLGGSATVNLALSTCTFSPQEEFADSNASILLPTIALLMGGRGGRSLASGGEGKVSQLEVLIGTLGL
jgi:hypothetical protein